MSSARWQGALVLAAALRGAAAGSNETPWAPVQHNVSGEQMRRNLVQSAASGQPLYWVKLRSLTPAVGELEPPFTEDGTRFKLELKDPKLEELRLDMALDRNKYSDKTNGLPEILVNGQILEYDPTSEPKVIVSLNETVGPLDKEVVVQVRDRLTTKGWFGLQGQTHHDYTIHVRQPPEFEEVAKATGIAVRAADTELSADKKFDGNRKIYNYNIEEPYDTVEVQATCTEYATSMKFNGDLFSNGTWLPVDISGASTSVEIKCIYFDEKWSLDTYEQTYQLNFKRNVTYSEDTAQLIVKMQPLDGYCVMKEGERTWTTFPHAGVNVSDMVFAERTLMLTWAEAQKNPPGDIVCRTTKADTKVVPLFRGMSGAYMTIRHGAHGDHEKMINGAPHDLHVGKGRQNYTVRVTLGTTKRDYNLTMMWPQTCDKMQCPKGKASKIEAVDVGSTAWSRLCLEEKCSDLDVAHCCQGAATCDTFGYPCPAHTVLRHNAAKVHCHGTECRQDEAKTCCEPRAKCSGFHSGCGADMLLKAEDKLDKIECEGAECTEKDRDVCCQEKAPCSSYTGPCPARETVRMDAEDAFCDGLECTDEDMAGCCEPQASCRDFALAWTCPDGQAIVQPPTKTKCKGDECSAEDVDICCEPRGKCSDFHQCPAHTQPKSGSEEALCKYSQCSAHHDQSTCCTIRASCANAMTNADCPDGHWLPSHNESLCAGEECTDEEKAACCKPMASCAKFLDDCPAGHMLQLSRYHAHCRSEECDEHDSKTCCSPIPGILGAPRSHASDVLSADVAEYLEQNPDSMRKVSGLWIIGLEDRDCHSTCKSAGLVCTEAGLYAKNADVDSEEEVLDLMRASNHLDLQTYDGDCPEDDGTNWAKPLVWADGCIRSAEGRPLDSFDCSAAPDEDEKMMRHRVCYCHEVINDISELADDDARGEVSSANEEGTTSEPYDCAAGFAHWEAGWSDSKQEWCCENKGIACEGETKELLDIFSALITTHDCWHVDVEDWSSSQTHWCSREHGVHVAATATGRYRGRSLVMKEGKDVGDFKVETLGECAQKCDETPECNSFSFSLDAGLTREGCNLKDKVVAEDEAGSDNPKKGDYRTYYRAEARDPVTTNKPCDVADEEEASADADVDGYEGRSLVKEEGESVGDFLVETLNDCARHCDETPECNSFSFSAKAFKCENKGCNLKSKVVTADEAESDNPEKGDYKSYYKVQEEEVQEEEAPSTAGYGHRSLVKMEGESVGDFVVGTLNECVQKCEETPECESFSFSAFNSFHKSEGCHLKDKCVTADEAESDSTEKGDYKSYYKLTPSPACAPCETFPVNCAPSGSDIQAPTTTPAPTPAPAPPPTPAPTLGTTSEPYDCAAGFDHWEQGWSDSKKVWCCENKGIGCAPPAPTPAQEIASRMAALKTFLDTKQAPRIHHQEQTTSPPYDCAVGLAHWEAGWSDSKKEWCCETKGINCEDGRADVSGLREWLAGHTPADSEDLEAEWTQAVDADQGERTQGCGSREGTASEPYDCDAGVAHWERGWSDSKKDWCCECKGIGCEGGGAASEPYDCDAGFAHWEAGWSDSKKEWCCETKGIGCEASDGGLLRWPQRLHAASVWQATFAGVTPFRAVCVLAAGGVAVTLLTLAVLSRASTRRFDRLPQPSSDALPAEEPLVAATVE